MVNLLGMNGRLLVTFSLSRCRALPCVGWTLPGTQPLLDTTAAATGFAQMTPVSPALEPLVPGDPGRVGAGSALTHAQPGSVGS